MIGQPTYGFAFEESSIELFLKTTFWAYRQNNGEAVKFLKSQFSTRISEAVSDFKKSEDLSILLLPAKISWNIS